MKAKGSLYPNAAAIIAKQLTGPVERAAKAYADQLSDNLAAGSRSGVQYPSLPRQSSAPGEFQQEQSGSLRDAVGVRDTPDPLRKQAGFFGLPQDRLNNAEYGRVGGRAPLARTAADNKTRTDMLTAARKG